MPLISFILYKITKLLVGITPLGSVSQITSRYGLINSTTLTTRLPKEKMYFLWSKQNIQSKPIWMWAWNKVWQSQCLGVRPAHTTMTEVIKHSMHSSAPKYYTLPRLSLTQFLFKIKIADMTLTSAGYCFSIHDTSSTFSVASPEKRGGMSYQSSNIWKEKQIGSMKKILLLLVMLAITGWSEAKCHHI